MNWSICLILSICVFLYGIIRLLLQVMPFKTKGKPLNIIQFLVVTTFTASVIMFLPIYNQLVSTDILKYFKVLLLSIHNSIRLFVVDGEFDIISENLTQLDPTLSCVYSSFSAIIFVMAPVLTFGVVLSFFANLSSHWEFLLAYFRDIYVFSDLNEKSIILAESIREKDHRNKIIFTDVFINNEEGSFELEARARAIGAVCFKEDILAVNLKHHGSGKDIYFFIMGEQEPENIEQTIGIISRYKNKENTHLYTFSNTQGSELFMSTVDKGVLKIRRIDMIRSLVNRILYDEGMRLFEKAMPRENQDKLISVVIVGMGQHGCAMLKALTWFCQMDGYEVQIDAFDMDPLAEEKFMSQCPELMSYKHNGADIPGDCRYTIRIHSGIDVETKKFTDQIQGLKDATFLFVSLGEDERNIQTAVHIRTLYERMNRRPMIQAIVYNSSGQAGLNTAVNFKNQRYDIEFIGDLRSSYTEKVIMGSELEKVALARHMRWGSEEEFWKYEYNYRSSVAAAIHEKMRLFCGIPGADKEKEERSEAELWGLRILEHKRWNAYMRSEGYCYDVKRNDLAKTHHCLVPFDELSDKDKEKDD